MQKLLILLKIQEKMPMFKKIIFLSFLIFFTLNATQAIAKINLICPDKVARGDAFIVTATFDENVGDFIFSWNNKKLPAQGNSLANGKWQASIMLPVSLDEKNNSGELIVSLPKKNLSTKKLITFFDKKRPIQKLSVDKKFVNPPKSEMERIKNDRIKVKNTISNYTHGRMWEVPFYRPVLGSVSSLFGLKRVFNGQPKGTHRGLDLRGPTGDPIKACADGQVVLVDNLYYSGNAIYINHGEGVFTAYLHMSEQKVEVNQYVKRGDIIGLVGATGRVTGPHLHLTLIVQGQSVDPEPFIENIKKSGAQ